MRSVIFTPTHQFPTGTALAPERRQALVGWANHGDGTIIEDDYDASSPTTAIRWARCKGWLRTGSRYSGR